MKLGLTYHNAFDFQAARQAYQEGFVLWQRMAERAVAGRRCPRAPRPAGDRYRTVTLGPAWPWTTLASVLRPALQRPGGGRPRHGRGARRGPQLGGAGGRPQVRLSPAGRRALERWRAGDGQDFEFAWKRVLDPSRAWSALAPLLFDIKGAQAYHQGEITDPDRWACAPWTIDAGRRAGGADQLFSRISWPSCPCSPCRSTWWRRTARTGRSVSTLSPTAPFWLAVGSGAIHRAGTQPHLSRALRGQRGAGGVLFPARPAGPALCDLYDGGSAGHLYACRSAEWARARQRYAGEYVSGPWLSTGLVGFDVSRPPFDDLRVRQAFALATDRETLADVTLRGYAFPGRRAALCRRACRATRRASACPTIPKGAPLLAEAGYPGGRGFPAIDCLARDDPGHDLPVRVPAGPVVGEPGDRDRLEADGVGKFRRHGSPKRRRTCGWWAGGRTIPTPTIFCGSSGGCAPGWQNEDYDRLVEGARRVMDQEERMRMYQQADWILVEEAPWCHLLRPVAHAGQALGEATSPRR